MEVINGYVLQRPFSSVGAGTASWTIAYKDGKDYFLKRFNAPKYVPSCAEYCHAYEVKKNKLYAAIKSVNNGNLVVIEDFFRWETFYYVATQRVREDSVTAERVHLLPMKVKWIIMKTLTHCMMQLEKSGIVHADLKPSNIMLKPTGSGYYSLKLIDFDSSFFEEDPPEKPEDMEGDMTYLSPEMLMGMCGQPVRLTSKIDVFAMGIMFHLFLTGRLPSFDSDYDSVCEVVANGGTVHLSSLIGSQERSLIVQMLRCDPEQRPCFSEVFAQLVAIEQAAETGVTRTLLRKAGGLD